MNMSGNIGGALCPVVVAALVKLTGHWEPALLLFVAIHAGAVVSWLLLDTQGSIFPAIAKNEAKEE
jgi:nitrate/nitrite transporter NarK